MFSIIIEPFFFFLPAAVANMAPVFAARYNWFSPLNKPLDNKLTFRGSRLLGDNKTLRGLIIGIIAGSLTAVLQANYQSLLMTALAGALLGFGALLGDAIASFFKRQLHYSPGQSWIPFDQVDFILGAIAVSFWFTPLSIFQLVIALVLFGFSSYITSALGTAIKIKKSL
jgi:CDP-2,3-bis-(O-geranylgeranyl)-sn-glycerol synthase